MLFLRVLGLLPGGRSSRVDKSHHGMPAARSGIHPHRFQDGTINPVERQFNRERLVCEQPEAYKRLMQDPIYRHYVWKHQAKQGIGEEIDQALKAPCVLGDFSSSPTEEHPHITRPLPEIRQFKAMKPEKGR